MVIMLIACKYHLEYEGKISQGEKEEALPNVLYWYLNNITKVSFINVTLMKSLFINDCQL